MFTTAVRSTLVRKSVLEQSVVSCVSGSVSVVSVKDTELFFHEFGVSHTDIGIRYFRFRSVLVSVTGQHMDDHWLVQKQSHPTPTKV